MTLQDIAMIAGLPIEGNPLCMSTDSDGWREQMHALIGMVPPEPPEPAGEDKKKERVATVLLSAGLHGTLVLVLRKLIRMRSRHMLVSTCGTLYPGLCLLMAHPRMLHGCG